MVAKGSRYSLQLMDYGLDVNILSPIVSEETEQNLVRLSPRNNTIMQTFLMVKRKITTYY